SHDRWFVSQLANRVLETSPRGIQDFSGSYEEYLERLGDDHLDAEVVLRMRREQKKKAAARAAAPALSDRQRQQRQRELGRRRDELTVAVEQAESRVHAINEMFCDPTFFERTSRDQVRKLEEEQQRLTAKVEELMSTWEQVETELSALAEISG